MINPESTLKKPKLEESIAKLRKIQTGLKRNLSDLHQKLEVLDSKSELQINLEDFKRDVSCRQVTWNLK
jgi:hypothetical protein